MAGETYNVEIRGRDNVSPALRQVARTAETTTDKVWKFSASLDHITNLAGKFVSGMDAVADAMVGPIEKAIEAERVDARLEAQLRATGQAAGYAFDEIDALAQSYSRLTAVDDEAVKGAQSLLLSYTNLTRSGGVFESALALTLDLSEATGKGLTEAAKKVGKALNDPARELNSLKEEGIVFTEVQRDMIEAFDEANNMAAAQAIVIDELSQSFSGSAAAAADNFGGALRGLSNAWDEVQESIGKFVTQNAGAEALLRALSGGLADLAAGLEDSNLDAQIASAEIFQSVLLVTIDVVDAATQSIGSLALTALEIREFFTMPEVSAAAKAIREESIALYQSFDAQVETLARVGRTSEVAARRIVRGSDDAAEAIAQFQAETGLQTEAAAELVESTFDLWQEHARLEKQYERMVSPASSLRDSLKDISEEMAAVRARVAEVNVADSFDPFADEVRAATTEIERLEDQLRNLTAAVSPEAAERLLGIAEVVREEFGGSDNLVILEQWTQWLEDLGDEARDLAQAYATSLIPQVQAGTDAFEATAEAADNAWRSWERFGSGPGPVAAPDGLVEFSAPSEFDGAPAFDPAAAEEEIAAEAAKQEAFVQLRADYFARVDELEEAWAARSMILAADVSYSLSNAFVDAASGIESLDDGMESFFERLEQGMWTALLDPILGAQGPMTALFDPVMNSLQSVGRMIAANFLQPLINGVIQFFGLKTAQETLATQASVISQTAAAAEIAGIHAGTLAVMMPGLSAAATASLIATFGASASAAALLPGLLATGAAQGKALAAIGSMPTPMAEGGFVSSPTLILAGEAGGETVVPETRRGRALEVLADMYERHPELAAAAPTQGGGASFHITIQQYISGDADPGMISDATVEALDRAIGRRYRAA